MPLNDDEIWSRAIGLNGEYTVTTGVARYEMYVETNRSAINFRIPTRDAGVRCGQDRVDKAKFVSWYRLYRQERNEGRNGRNRALYRNVNSPARRATYLFPVFDLMYLEEMQDHQ